MSVSERRIARRFILNVPLQLLPIKGPSQAAWAVETMNISTRGVYFTTDLPLAQGQLVQVLLQMPKEITGNVVNPRRFTGRVAHVDPNGFANGISGVGVQFLYYGELALQLHEQELESSEARSIQQGLLPKEIRNSPGTRSPPHGSPHALSVVTISMSFLLTPIPWGFVLPTLRAKDSPPRS